MSTPERRPGDAAAPETPAERLALYAATLRRRWQLAAAIVLAALLTGLVVAALTPKSYDANAKVLLGEQRQVDALLGAGGPSQDPERDLNTGLELITLEPVADGVRRNLGLDLTTQDLLAKVSASVDSNSDVVSITARDGSPVRAAAIANAFAAAYRDFRARSARAGVEAAVASGQERLRRLAPGSDREALSAELRRLRVAAAFQTGGVQIVRQATAASASSHPRPLFAAAVAALLGLVLAGVVIVVLARTDKLVRDVRQLEEATGAPVLGVVPEGRRAASTAREALVTVAMSLAHPRGRKPVPAVIVVSSPGPGEGTTGVTLGLARALGNVGRRAIAIEADLRHPSFGTELGLGPHGGLLAMLENGDASGGELVALDRRGDRSAGAWALPAGATSELPQALLASEDMAQLVERAGERAEIVLIAAAPVGEVSDALALGPLVDAVLLVAQLDATRVDELDRAVRALRELDARLLGTVATTGRPGVKRNPRLLPRAGLARDVWRRLRGTASTTSEAPVR